MNEKNFLQKMENLKKPEINADATHQQIRLAIMNSRKSAAWGIWLLVLPVAFLKLILIKELLHWDWGLINSGNEWIVAIDRNIPWSGPILFVLLPGIAALVNLLAIMHFVYDRSTRELIVTIKMKWLNILLIAISAIIIGIVSIYIVLENSTERAIHKMEQEQRSK